MSKDSEENRSRALRRMAVVSGWVDLVTSSDVPRYSLHLNVAFREERMGGGVDEPVRFRVTLKRCEVVIVLPRHEPGILVDPKTIARQPPSGPVTVTTESTTSASVHGSAGLDLGSTGAAGSVKVGAGGERKVSKTDHSSETLPRFDALHSESRDGHLCWLITTTVSGGRLTGSLWDPHTEPRLHIVDGRPKNTRDLEKKTNNYPNVTVEVRCKREDLEITDIALTDDSKQAFHMHFFGTKKRVKAAEAFIKAELEKEGLRVGNISELFSDLVVSDRLMPLRE